MASIDKILAAYKERVALHETGTSPFAKGIAWIENKLVPLHEARIPILDQGFWHSDLAYDAPAVWNGRFFRLDDHIDRLDASCDKILLKSPLPRDEMKRILCDMVSKTGLRDAQAVIIVTRGLTDVRGWDPRKLVNNLYMFVKPYGWLMQPENHYAGGSAMVARTVHRIPPGAIDPTVKNLQWGDLIRSVLEAQDCGATYPFLTDQEGNLTEGPGFNIHLVQDGLIYTPDRGVLQGITRRSVFDLCKANGVEIRVDVVPVDMVYQCEEIFLSSTAGGILPITKLDGVPVRDGKPGPITMKVWDAYWEMHDDAAYNFQIEYTSP
ncbi:putative branched-chain-amino-acid aminotransferase [Metarhizium anisopliae]|nr:putative branched-chain-amino-acid aminotransferase [Metarhizium anisopliae]